GLTRAALCVRLVESVLRRYLLLVETGINDLRLLGTSGKTKISGTSVIWGGSIAGLLTGGALDDHFERVVIVKSEEWLSGEEGREIETWTQLQPHKRLVQYQSQNPRRFCKSQADKIKLVR
ncbi:hypothetical protein BDZ89DRAFT_960921, partial [Hymenopellis radicata]